MNEAFKLVYGDYTDEEFEFINEVLVGVKKRSEGNVHISFDFDFDELIKDKNAGKSTEDILDETFIIMKKLESGEIKGKPYTDDVERFSFEDIIKKKGAFEKFLDENSDNIEVDYSKGFKR